MAESIETFVAKLQQEGVEAGRAEAQKQVQEAEARGVTILSEAKSQAEKIIADAESQARDLVARGRTELTLASRDIQTQLRESLSEALGAILAEATKTVLTDADFLGQVLHEIIVAYTRADLEGKGMVRINVSEEMRDQLRAWAIKEIGSEIDSAHPHIDLKGRLKQAGFEYATGTGTVEVTVDSVSEILGGMISPRLREILSQSAETK